MGTLIQVIDTIWFRDSYWKRDIVKGLLLQSSLCFNIDLPSLFNFEYVIILK